MPGKMSHVSRAEAVAEFAYNYSIYLFYVRVQTATRFDQKLTIEAKKFE